MGRSSARRHVPETYYYAVQNELPLGPYVVVLYCGRGLGQTGERVSYEVVEQV